MIEGRVAQILNERELIINRGLKDGVVRGTYFDVLSGDPVQVTDPETGEALGTLERPKLRVRVVDVHDRFSVCRVSTTIGSGESRIAPPDFFAPRGRASATLTWSEPIEALSPEDRVVKVGDRVKQRDQTESIPFQADPKL